MTRQFKLKFLDNIPNELDEGVLYISMKYHTTAHLCACGCGEKVVNPLNRKYGWTLTFDGQRVSLSPSIGNYQFPCCSHYYIKLRRTRSYFLTLMMTCHIEEGTFVD